MSEQGIDQVMERASEKLAATEYDECERLCLQALRLARTSEQFERYARILLPLQEARRQRRQIAAEAGVTVLTEREEPASLVERHRRGCLLLIVPPWSFEDERQVRRLAVERGLYIEALALDQDGLRQAFEQQMEREGDAALARIRSDLSAEQRVDRLAEVLDRVGDHEFAHQRLAEAAREAAAERARQSAGPSRASRNEPRP